MAMTGKSWRRRKSHRHNKEEGVKGPMATDSLGFSETGRLGGDSISDESSPREQ